MQSEITFTVNTCPTDSAFFESTIRSVIRTLDFPFAERLIFFDDSGSEGAFRRRDRGQVACFRSDLSQLVSDRIVDRIVDIPWGDDVEEILSKTYGPGAGTPKDQRGAPIYQYLHAWNNCKTRYILHMDADILFHRGQTCWITEGLQLLKDDRRALCAAPYHPPCAQNLFEAIIGRPLRPKAGWVAGQDFSTRFCLLDLYKLEEMLPLSQESSGLSLERSIRQAMKQQGYYRHTRVGTDAWAIHPNRHNDITASVLPELIWAVENGLYPFVRPGHPWDLSTSPTSITLWLHVIQQEMSRRGMPALQVRAPQHLNSKKERLTGIVKALLPSKLARVLTRLRRQPK